MVDYRSFRNYDQPGMAEVWNETFTGRGSVRLRHSSPLENYVIAKPYFDANGLIMAVEDNSVVGFAHAGFTPNKTQSGLSHEDGVLCLMGVRPSHQRRGIGSELLRRCEAYLTERGSQNLYAGPMAPLNPFYFGLYGGSGSSGFLASDAAAGPFLQRHGYQMVDKRLVFQRSLTQPVNIGDGRFAALRRRFDVRIAPRSGAGTWWQECTVGPVEMVEFHLDDKVMGLMAAKISVWEMDLYGWRWNQAAVGIMDIEVLPELRRQGLAKFLLTQMLRYLQEQFFGIAEIHLSESNQAAITLFQALGFQQVDVGYLYKKSP